MNANDARIRPQDFAAELGISVSKARELCATGKLEAINVGDGQRKHWRTTRAAVDAFKDQRRNRKVPARPPPKIEPRNLIGI